MKFLSKKLYSFRYLLVLTLLLVIARSYAQTTGTPPLSSPRIDRVEKPYTAAEAAILSPREGTEKCWVWSTLCKCTEAV